MPSIAGPPGPSRPSEGAAPPFPSVTSPQRRSRLSTDRIRRVQDLVESEGLGARAEPFPRLAPGAEAPLSFAQERLWFLARLWPESPAFHVPAAWRVRGALDPDALERALVALARRHPALRTRFPARGGRPRQEVEEEPRVALERETLPAAASPAAREAAALARARAWVRRPFDLERAPLARFLLLTTASDEHLLVLCVHHAVCEVQSLGILARDLASLVAAAAEGRAAALPALAASFADFAAWQRARAEGPRAAAALSFWRGRLAGALDPLELPTDRPRPALQGLEGGVVERALPAELSSALRAWAARSGRTLFAPLAAAFATLLARLADAREVRLGVPVTERDHAALAGVVGFFVNTLVLRCELEDGPGLDALSARVEAELHAAREHQELPFERLVAALAPERDLSRTPLVQAAFLLQYADEGGPERLPLGPGATLEALDPLAVHTGTAKYDLALVALVEGERVRLALEHASELFEPATAARMLEQLELLLAQALAAPERSLLEHDLVTPGERALLARWNASPAPGPARLVHEVVLAQAARDPQAVAVVDGAATLTYGALAARARRLARRLRALGVGPEVVVALAAERSPEMVVGALAVLEAGGAYLPLDLSWPRERLAFQIRDAAAPLVLSRAALRERLPAHAGRTLFLDEEEAALEALSDAPLAPAARGEDLAYVIHTSGSTGVPKGVAVTHAGLWNLVAWHLRAYGVGPRDRATHLAGLAFDAAVWELWPILCAGGTLCLVPDEARLAPARLAAFLAERAITLAFLPTPLCEALLAEPLQGGLALRALLTGGDRLRAAPARPLPFALVNHYGPTECSVVATAGPVTPGASGAPSIGRPIDGVRVHLLDARGRDVPIGAAGEIFLAGASLARGYHRRPERTAERFVPDPRGREPRLYATGDRARWRVGPGGAGELEFLGRRDGQVKVRGVRVELGEVEAQLARAPGVRQCACALVPGAGGARLVAWVVAEPGATAERLAAFLRARLPEPMCPAAYVRLEALPLTPNGKLDRAALPAPDDAPSAAFAAPEGELEERIAAVWGEVLARPAIDAHANFFDQGGHSLALARVQALLGERLGRELGMVELFQHPTVSALARHLEARGAGAPALAEAERRAAGRLARLARRRVGR